MYPYGRVFHPAGVVRPIVHSPLLVPGGYGLGVPIVGFPHHQPVLVGHPGAYQPVVLGQPHLIPQQTAFTIPQQQPLIAQQQVQQQPYPPPVAAGEKPASAESVWDGPLLKPDHTPTHLLLILVHALYDHLDRGIQPASQGGLSPEKIGIMAELCGLPDEENIYKAIRAMGHHMGQGDAYIDKQFTMFYTSFRFQYALAVRQGLPVTSSLNGGTTFTSTQSSQIPLLTRDGLVAFFVNNILEDPKKQHAWLSSILLYIQLYHPGTGKLLPRSIPRSVFPANPEPATAQRNAAIRTGLQQQHQREYGSNGLAPRAPTPTGPNMYQAS